MLLGFVDNGTEARLILTRSDLEIPEVNAMSIMLVCCGETAFGTQEERSLAVPHRDDHCRGY